MKDLMLDLETMGDQSNAAIIQIGACYFDRKTGKIGKTLLRNVELESSMKAGLMVSASTINWWLNQSPKARAGVSSSSMGLSLQTALGEFTRFVDKSTWIWSHATFDFVILTNAYKTLGLEVPYRYTVARDLRTLVDLAKIDVSSYKRVGTHHDALDDCKFQVQYAVDAIKKLSAK